MNQNLDLVLFNFSFTFYLFVDPDKVVQHNNGATGLLNKLDINNGPG